MHIHTQFRQALLAENEHRLAAAAERHRLLEEARRSRRRGAEAQLVSAQMITIRRATASDAAALAKVAALDSSRRLEGEILVALVEGELVAALSLSDGRSVGDPFRATSEARDLLELRRTQLTVHEGDRGWLHKILHRRRDLEPVVSGGAVPAPEGSCC